jgi:hypothetical protein
VQVVPSLQEHGGRLNGKVTDAPAHPPLQVSLDEVHDAAGAESSHLQLARGVRAGGSSGVVLVVMSEGV